MPSKIKPYSFSFVILAILIWNCKENKADTMSDSKIPKVVKTPAKLVEKTINSHFFEAQGEDWELTISNQTISFKSKREGFETFYAPTTDPDLAQDANVKRYRSIPELGTIIVNISQEECTSNSKIYQYRVKVEIKRGIDEGFTSFEGCGNYLLDYRLHDIWTLKTLNGEVLNPEEFREELPRIEINAAQKSFRGFAGCNRMTGQIFSEDTLLRFSKIVTTEMLCAPPNKENEFLKALQATTSYKIENNRLILSNPNGLSISFKKID